MNTNQANTNNDNRTESELEASVVLSTMFQRTMSFQGEDTEMTEVRDEEAASTDNADVVEQSGTTSQQVTNKSFGKLPKRPNGSRVKKPMTQRANGNYEKYSDAKIALAVESVKIYGMSVDKAAGRTGIKVGTLRDTLRRYKARGKASPSTRGHKAKSSFTEETVSFILNEVDENPNMSVEDIYFAFVDDGTIATPAVSSLQNWLRKNAQITFQRVPSYPSMPSEEEEEEYTHKYWQTLNAGEVNVRENCIFIGEASYVYNLRRTYPETRPKKSRKEEDHHDVADLSMLIAFGTAGIVEQGIRCLECPTSTQDMTAFVKRVMTKLSDQSRENFFFGLDSGPAEEVEQVKKEIEDWGHKVFFLPRHDGSWNPAEKIFREVQRVCSRSLLDQRKNETIIQRLESAMDKIDPPKCASYIDLAFPIIS
ncbi:hypothetical protein INT45_001377 [Circinella minor]|uniref:Tc1-like transposase DDE domain-containing protein n=1 Tax=Circinella minor TaxID=1195481 RepID=A0A8H7RTI9_9FUNG|nr:hypothetical protein INT45_001377 [Circinella minor]